jgi:hypothetical protein
MAAIDYTIPGQIKSIQLESPINQMMSVAQLQSAQNQNALAKYQLGAAQRAEEKEVNRMRLLEQAGGDEAAVANALLKAGDVAGYSAYVKAIEDRKTQKLNQQKASDDIVTTRLAQSKSLLDNIDPNDPNAGAAYIAWHEANHADPYLGPRLAAMGVTADQSRARINAAIQQGPAAVATLINQSRLGIDKFKEKQKVEDDLAYSDYVRATVMKDERPLPKAEFLAQRNQPPVPVAAPTIEPPAAEAESVQGVKKEGGEGEFPDVEFSNKNLIDESVAALLATGDPRDKAIAEVIQKRLESKQLGGDFKNIATATREVDKLKNKKNPTPLDLALIKNLEGQINAVNEGRATKINMPVSLSTEKKWGETFGTEVAKQDIDLKKAAEGAPEAAATSNRVLQLLSTGQVFTGTGANVKLQLAKLLRLGGATDNEAIANTEVLISSLADTTLGAIKSSGLGAGQGFTNTDRDFLERAKAGQITYDAKSLRDLANLAYRASKITADKWNKRRSQMPQDVIKSIGIDTSDIEVPPMFGAKPTGGNKPAGKMSNLPTKNSKGWVLHIDKNGNSAYVSPDGKQFEEVK